MTRLLVALSVCLLIGLPAFAKAPNNLRACWNQQVRPLQNTYTSWRYQETLNKLEHSFQPWQATTYTGTGRIWSNARNFLKSDTLHQGTKTYFSQTHLTPTTLLFQDYGDKQLTRVTQGDFQEQPLQAARYEPSTLIQYFFAAKSTPEPESTRELVVYKATLHRTIVRLYIRTADNLLSKVTTLQDDDLFGDVHTTYTYENYAALGKLTYPKTVTISKINGKLTDKVMITAATLVSAAPTLLAPPVGYTLAPEVVAKPETSVEHYSPHLHLIGLPHTDDKVLLVEFDTFLLVAEAPLNSQNGELIIAEARKIAPRKPIRYFVAGHYHPHYLGGLRPFVHRGATILTTAADVPYVQYLAAAPHTLRPDSLQLQPKLLQTEEIQHVKTISDGKFEMQIHVIGSKSQHTNDYLIYYFPSEKLLFEDDLVWIARQGEIKKASPRQAGLYQAVQELGLQIDTILQSWPVKDYGVKTVIPFRDLEQSMQVK
ncbi:hypothetical protein MTX78_07940 [Hymenobacter tibetensis]|uniref:MBL fold metallo-hydrolase n=1 Tax=Hymenobacter tibetensis TaxID=497967 RepID=A0ABY4D1V7_9BACT|nr:hypothetical protein [Hymenobacter tibetensis]UOG76519.1 hypothetical protein MTX78_07940 [Hymenobacter tibetensis]